MIYYQSRRPINVSHLTNSFCQSYWLNAIFYFAANSNNHYLKHLLPISTTCKFHIFHVYWQSPLLADSTGLPLLPNSIACKFLQYEYDFTVKVHFHYMQIPRQPIYYQNPLLADSITCKFTQPFRSCQTNRSLSIPISSQRLGQNTFLTTMIMTQVGLSASFVTSLAVSDVKH